VGEGDFDEGDVGDVGEVGDASVGSGKTRTYCDGSDVFMGGIGGEVGRELSRLRGGRGGRELATCEPNVRNGRGGGEDGTLSESE
jgi:hypothetical protein